MGIPGVKIQGGLETEVPVGAESKQRYGAYEVRQKLKPFHRVHSNDGRPACVYTFRGVSTIIPMSVIGQEGP